jgi:hypothetical protein
VVVISKHNHVKGTGKLLSLPRMYPEKNHTDLRTSRNPVILKETALFILIPIPHVIVVLACI